VEEDMEDELLSVEDEHISDIALLWTIAFGACMLVAGMILILMQS